MPRNLLQTKHDSEPATEAKQNKDRNVNLNKLELLPYLSPQDTLSAHGKHTIPSASQLFSCSPDGAALPQPKGSGPLLKVHDQEISKEDSSKTLTLNGSAEEEQAASVSPETQPKNSSESHGQSTSSGPDPGIDCTGQIPSSSDDALQPPAHSDKLSVLSLKKTVSFQDEVLTHTMEDFEERLREVRQEKKRNRGNHWDRFRRSLTRLFSCGK
ncbi:hypothetical protein HDV03_000806 [Kappamyces sp. JEL0829]|nr:hypothetical protein HDV03_000806 [Kappamyces sp. JEL0829]